MEIEFIKTDSNLILRYTSSTNWIDEPGIEYPIKLANNAIILEENDRILTDNDECDGYVYEFNFGVKNGNYYKISKEKIGTTFDLYINELLEVDWTWFYCITMPRKYKDKEGNEKSTSIYGCLLHCFKEFYNKEKLYFENDDFQQEEDDGMHITKSTYQRFVDKFPTATNVKYQKLSILTSILRDELDVKDYDQIYNSYKKRAIPKQRKRNIVFNAINDNDIQKYKFAKELLEKTLEENKQGKFVHEDEFTKIIVKIFCLINPKYIMIKEKLNIVDFCNSRNNCQPDISLIDCDGNIDIIEVKSPNKYPNIFRKTKYRSHYVTCGELNGAINQLQQYLKSLTKMSDKDIQNKNLELQQELGDVKLRAIHPKGFVIFGRDESSFCDPEKELKKIDFEIIKNTHSNIVDILTFDQLIVRIDRILEHLENK